VAREDFSDVTYLLEARHPVMARAAKAGQSVIAMSRPEGARIPLTIADYDRAKGTITLVEFIACDARHANHFAKVPRAAWNSGMAPVSECLGPGTPGVSATLPALFMVDGEDRLEKAIVDASAGTYWQRVEAAESCQMAVIHPGKPRNPNEPGLEELLKRAEAFL
jgi:hypothetical protein